MLNDRKRKARINHNDYDLRIEIDYKICAVVWSIWTSTCLHINKMEARSLVFNRVSKRISRHSSYRYVSLFIIFVDFTSLANLHKNMPQEWLNVNTVFLSIIFEAIPFILLGVIVSSCIQVFVTEDMIQKVLPKSPIVAMIPAVFVGVLFPMCECVIIPIVRRLIQRGYHFM